MTRVSVGLPVYNAECYVAEALESLVSQTHTDLEIVVSDNGSTDDTAAICASFARRDRRIRFVRQPVNRGAAFNHTTVARLATAPYFRWFAADDLLAPDCLRACAKVLDDRPDVVLAWPLPVEIDSDGGRLPRRPVGDWDDGTPSSRLRSLLGQQDAPTVLGMCRPVYGLVRRDAFLAAMPLGAYGGADNVVLARLALAGRWWRLDGDLAFNRVHATSSMASSGSLHAVAAWMDPAATPRRSVPYLRRETGFLRAVLSAPLPAGERLRSLTALAHQATRRHAVQRVVWDVRVLGGDLLGRPEAELDWAPPSLRPAFLRRQAQRQR